MNRLRKHFKLFKAFQKYAHEDHVKLNVTNIYGKGQEPKQWVTLAIMKLAYLSKGVII